MFSGFVKNSLYNDAWQVIFESYYKKVYRIAFSITMDEELSKEIVQITFLKAYEKINSLKDKDKFEQWISAIAANVAKDMLKKKIIHKEKNMSLYDDEGNLQEYLTELINFSSPEDQIEATELVELIMKIIDELKEEDRLVLHLWLFEGLSYEQISKQINMKKSTVGMKIMRSKLKVANKLKKYLGMGDGMNDENRVENSQK